MISAPIASDPIICFFFKPSYDGDKLSQKLNKPGKIAKHTIHNILNHIPIAGIYTTYNGYITISDENGEVQFPRKQRENEINILITTEIEPVALFENTIKHWALLPQVPAQMYTLKEVYDPTTKGYAWESHTSDLPYNNIIPLNTIVIIAKPKNIFIPSEKVKTIKTANLTLPPMYVKKGIKIMTNGVNTLTIRHLFRPIQTKTKQEHLKLITHVLN